jgi:site-specific DNA-methyltransferase (adenine-specific)
MATVTLHLGDCLDFLATLDAGSVDAVVTDPPYGGNHKTNYRRFSGGKLGDGRINHAPVIGDDRPFDPAPWVQFPRVAMWGMNHYIGSLPAAQARPWLVSVSSRLGRRLP